MNYLAHAVAFLDRPHFMAGTAVPDWLAAADRSVRIRACYVEAYQHVADRCTAEVAAGALRHICDDARFHRAKAFVESSLQLTAVARDALDRETGFRPAFLGHLLVELLLDAALIADAPDRLTEYYHVLDRLDARQIEAATNHIAPRPTRRLAAFIDRFRRERILWDYLDDNRLMVRVNQVLRRIRFETLPDSFTALLPNARSLVAARKHDLLNPILWVSPEQWNGSKNHEVSI